MHPSLVTNLNINPDTSPLPPLLLQQPHLSSFQHVLLLTNANLLNTGPNANANANPNRKRAVYEVTLDGFEPNKAVWYLLLHSIHTEIERCELLTSGNPRG